jgi:hypothetical protein
MADQDKLGRKGTQAGIKNMKEVGVDEESFAIMVGDKRHIEDKVSHQPKG